MIMTGTLEHLDPATVLIGISARYGRIGDIVPGWRVANAFATSPMRHWFGVEVDRGHRCAQPG
jgi:hypothetical protein